MAELLAVSPRVSPVHLWRNHFNWYCTGELIISVTIQKLAPTGQGQNTDGPVNQRFCLSARLFLYKNVPARYLLMLHQFTHRLKLCNHRNLGLTRV